MLSDCRVCWLNTTRPKGQKGFKMTHEIEVVNEIPGLFNRPGNGSEITEAGRVARKAVATLIAGAPCVKVTAKSAGREAKNLAGRIHHHARPMGVKVETRTHGAVVYAKITGPRAS